MIKVGIFLCLLVLWVFATMTTVNESGQSKEAFIAKSIFYWLSIGIAIGLGSMH